MLSKPCRPLRRALVWLAGACAVSLAAGVARAEGSAPPESPYYAEREVERDPRSSDWAPAPAPESSSSLLRFSVGPALLFRPANPGLLTALDIGRRAVGARLSAGFLRAETDRGLASYTAELWVDLGHRHPLHPLLGAGASLLHGGALGRQRSSGAGVLRGALEYELPLDEADARVGLNVIALVPAIASDRTEPWVLGSVTIGAGF